MTLTHDELTEISGLLLGAALAAREAAATEPDQGAARAHRKRFEALLATLYKLLDEYNVQRNAG